MTDDEVTRQRLARLGITTNEVPEETVEPGAAEAEPIPLKRGDLVLDLSGLWWAADDDGELHRVGEEGPAAEVRSLDERREGREE